MTHRTPYAVCLLGVCATVLAGCGGTVTVTPAPAASAEACARVGAAYPAAVAGRARVATSSDSVTVAAWGDPAIIARCGVPEPGPTTECINVDGVDWVSRELDDGMAFTTYGRSPAVEVLIPRAYAPEPMLLGAFTSAGRSVTQGPHRCT